MKKITEVALEEAPEGAELAQDVLDERGNRMVSAGAILSDRSIGMLQNRDVKTVHIYEVEELSSEELKARRAEIAQDIEQRFRKVQDEPLMSEFKECLIDYRLKELQ